MAKLFQTISLEERLKNSSYNKLQTKPGPVEQGEASIRYPQDLLKKEGYLLKLTPNAQKENSKILKAYLETKQIQNLPAIKTNFGNKISLEDRLKQTQIASTNHLPEFYLSDVYTNYIKVKPFGVYNHTSNVDINPFGIFNHTSTIQVDAPTAVIAQGGFTPLPYLFNSILSQGVTLSNNVYSSFVTILFPGLVNQGPGIDPTPSVLTVNQGPGTDPTLPPTLVNQGPGVDPTLPPTLVNQGPGVDPTIAKSVLDIQLLQGLYYNLQGSLSSIIDMILAAPSPLNAGTQVPANVVIQQPMSVATMESLQLASINNTNTFGFTFPQQTPLQEQTPILNVLKYEADRALALYLPQAKHGSTTIPIQYFNQDEREPKYLNIGPVTYDPSKTHPDIIIPALGWQGSKDTLTDIVKSDAAKNWKANEYAGVPFIGNVGYRTLNYEQIIKRAKKEDSNRDFRNTLNIKTLTSADGQTTESIDYKRKSVDIRGISSDAKDDFVDFIIESKTSNSEFVKFRAFITTFSDSFNTTWNDINYIGRQDVIKTFKNVTRASSIGFKIAAFNSEDLKEQYKKLSALVKITSVGKLGSSNKYVTGPVCAITVGNWFMKTPCIFNSVKFDIQMAEYSWDIDKQVPHIIDVTADMVILGDLNGKPLNATSNNYFNYIG